MIESTFITFRECLEATLIIGIIVTCLKKSQRENIYSAVWIGCIAGIAGSIAGKILFDIFADGFSGRAEEIFEGITMLVGAGLLFSVILWLGKIHVHHIEIDKNERDEKLWFTIFILVFVSVLREGIETVIFLASVGYASDKGVSLIGASIGITLAIILGYLMFKGMGKVALKSFFAISSLVLLMFAAGLVAHGVHELQEAGVIPIAIEHIYDINYILDKKGYLGSLLKGLFGYNGNPSLIELLSYLLTLTFGIWMFKLQTSKSCHDSEKCIFKAIKNALHRHHGE